MKRVIRTLIAMAGISSAINPATAQVFYKAPDFSGVPVTALESGFDANMPGANDSEVRAALLWNFRSALNLAALQCQFEPMFRTVENYNALIGNHKSELDGAYAVLGKYFARVKKNLKAGQSALDSFSTRTISAYSTVRGQLGFCETSARTGRDALFVPRGSLGSFAIDRLRPLRNSLKPASEQQFPSAVYMRLSAVRYPSFASGCWSKKGYSSKCGYSWGIAGPPAS